MKLLKKIPILILFILFNHENGLGQVPISVRTKFNAAVILRLYDIAAKVKLTDQRQLEIARQFAHLDSLANKSLKNGADIVYVNSLCINNIANLKKILNFLELNDYLTANGKYSNQSAKALHFREDIHLTGYQIIAIEKVHNKYIDGANSNSPENQKAEISELRTILTTHQFDNFVELSSCSIALYRAAQEYTSVSNLGLISLRDSATILREIKDFETRRSVAINKANYGLGGDADSVKNRYDLFLRPAILLKLNVYIDNIYPSTFTTIFKQRRSLKLSQIQIDSLISKVNVFQKERYLAYSGGRNFASRTFESENIPKILDSTQITMFLTANNQYQAKANALNKWKRAEKMGFTQTLNAKSTIEILKDYELNYLVATDWLAFNRSQQRVSYRATLEAQKPTLLKQMDRADRADAANSVAKKNFAW